MFRMSWIALVAIPVMIILKDYVSKLYLTHKVIIPVVQHCAAFFCFLRSEAGNILWLSSSQRSAITKTTTSVTSVLCQGKNHCGGVFSAFCLSFCKIMTKKKKNTNYISQNEVEMWSMARGRTHEMLMQIQITPFKLARWGINFGRGLNVFLVSDYF